MKTSNKDSASPELALEYMNPSALVLNPRNARTHSPKQIAQIAASIREFGFTVPILVDRNNMVVSGHGRYSAAIHAGLDAVPVRRLDHLTPAQVKAYAIADNRLAELAGWDGDLLRIELEELVALDLDFDVSITGFDFADIDVLLASAADASAQDDPLDRLPEPLQEAVTRPGDLWQVGAHRLLCGDATAADSYAALLGDEKAQMVFMDPPYNVPIGGHVSGLGKVRHREFAMASGEMSGDQFTALLTGVFGHCAGWSCDGAIHYVCMDHRHLPEVLAAGDVAYSQRLNLCVWTKTNAGMGSLYRSQHELVLVFKAGKAPHINNVQLGRHGRYRTNVWTYPGANSFGRTRDADLAMHPTVKPVALVADAILDASRPKGIILDVFAGSGTTLVAAHRTRRRGFGIEIDPLYCDVALRRLGQVTGAAPIHAQTGFTFDEFAAKRAGDFDGSAEVGQ